MRTWPILVVVIASFAGSRGSAIAQTGAKFYNISGFMLKGAFHELDPALMRHRFSLAELAGAKLAGEPGDIESVLAWVAKCEKLGPKVEEPKEVQGHISISLPPNALGDEVYTACYYAFSFNGLGLHGVGDKVLLVRCEKHPRLPRLGGPWNRDRVFPTQLFRLGYLRPDPILRQYQEKIGSPEGRAALERKSNVLIVTDTKEALESLRALIDIETLEAMGVPAATQQRPIVDLRPPAMGAIATREAIHFYLLAFARWNRFPLLAARDRDSGRRYPEADVWMSDEAYSALAAEYQRIGELVEHAKQTGGEDWIDPNPERTLSPAEQRRMAIRFGLAGAAPERTKTGKSKKPARKR